MNDHSKIYITRAGGRGEDEENALDGGLAIIGFIDIPSVEKAQEYEEVFKIVATALPDANTRRVANIAGQVWTFAHGIKEGDIVVLPRKLTSQIALGRVTGKYRFQKIDGRHHHVRAVEWVRPDVARSTFRQDLLHSFGAFLTVCNISRNDAERRVKAVMEGKSDPGIIVATSKKPDMKPAPVDVEVDVVRDLTQEAHDQIVAHIQTRFVGHALTGLVDAVLRAEGWVTKVSPPGRDQGVDILAGRGSFGLDGPRLCVQVKSEAGPVDVIVFRNLQGTMQTFKAEQGLLVAWGGFNKVVQVEAKQGHFMVRLWDSGDLVEAIYRNYERLPAEIQAELPLKKVWMLVAEEPEG